MTPPSWVQNLPNDDLNKSTLIELLKAGVKPLDSPREMNFAINMIDSIKTTKKISKRLKRLGWKTEIIVDAGDGSGYWVEAKKTEYVINESRLMDDLFLFNQLAEEFRAVYDGWYAEAV